MTSQVSETQVAEWRAIDRNLRERSQRLWISAMVGLTVGTGITALAAANIGPSPVWLLLSPLVLAGCEVLNYFADRAHQDSQKLARYLDYNDGLGEPLPTDERRVLTASVPEKWKVTIPSDHEYFASDEPPGPKKLLTNLYEQSWFTERLAGEAALLFIVITVLLFLAGLYGLIALIELFALGNPNALLAASRAVSYVLLSTLVAAVLRSALSYVGLNEAAKTARIRSEVVLKGGRFRRDEVVALVQEYHHARSDARPIPSWLYRLRRDRLNLAWKMESAPRS